jgi:hypothetical protein
VPAVGREALATTLRGFLGAADEVDWQILSQWAIDRTVINERLDRFKIGSGWLELPIAGVFAVDDHGVITLWRDCFDMATYTRQLSELTPAMTTPDDPTRFPRQDHLGVSIERHPQRAIAAMPAHLRGSGKLSRPRTLAVVMVSLVAAVQDAGLSRHEGGHVTSRSVGRHG